MKKYIVAFFWFILTIAADAQYADFSVDTMPSTRNWVGINFTTAVTFLAQSVAITPHTGIWYKRQLTVSRNIRFSLNYYIYDPDDEFSIESGVSIYGDSATVYSMNTDRWGSDFRVGMEWFKPGTRVSPLYGADLLIGYEVENQKRHESYSRRDTTICADCFITDPDRAPYTFEQENGLALIGFDVFFGFQFRVAKHSAFALLFSPEIAYSFPVNENIRDMGGYYLPPTSTLRFTLRPLEFYYFYNF